ncbi:methionine ABC transporter ATP-binding protein [Propionicicella superfundia]|uniref:methionine ABC transporter ATP-binding protein n=1 Tax=Propionicicella superfundia TaxID=348582 RepID=UPI0004137376|nr:ATP-binding cassette domain-containing protein [Propionicicella superfundia]
MIDIENVSKTYRTPQGDVAALRDVSLHVRSGEIFGAIGRSGSGKTTLIRCINRLETIDQGRIRVGGEEITSMAEAELRRKRRKIGMIFQHFHLLRNDTVRQNVALPLRHSTLGRRERADKVHELLDVVGLGDRASAYPSQLSGGQRQRVAIARALANDPEILLCDEATSALDPETTVSILALLRDVNRSLGLTILLITHEMSVVKDICDRVAVLHAGEVAEVGTTADVFARPRHEATQQFSRSLFDDDGATAALETPLVEGIAASGGFVARLLFVGEEANAATISRLSRSYGVDLSVVYGTVRVLHGVLVGCLYVAFDGPPDRLAAAADDLRARGVGLDVVAGTHPRRAVA